MNQLQADPEILIAPIKKTVADTGAKMRRRKKIQKQGKKRSNLSRLVRKTSHSLVQRVKPVNKSTEQLVKFHL